MKSRKSKKQNPNYRISEPNQVEAGARGLIIEPCDNGEWRWEADCGSGYCDTPEAAEAEFAESIQRSTAAALLGALGGKAGKGKSKRRDTRDPEYYRKLVAKRKDRSK